MKNLIKFVDELNHIQSPTDHEEEFLEYLIEIANKNKIPYSFVDEKSYLKNAPILFGNIDANYIFVTHCDRVQENSHKLVLCKNNIKTVEGKLDNVISLAICLKLLIELKPSNVALLVTTGEESRYKIQEGNNNPLIETGGRGLISYFEDNIDSVSEKYYICVDVRPLDRGGVSISGTKKYMNLGDGLVLRINEKRDNVDINANEELLSIIKSCAKENQINLVEYSGSGITELGRAWEKMIQPSELSEDQYRIAWIQPPITHYHTKYELMSKNDIDNLQLLIKSIIEVFETKS